VGLQAMGCGHLVLGRPCLALGQTRAHGYRSWRDPKLMGLALEPSSLGPRQKPKT